MVKRKMGTKGKKKNTLKEKREKYDKSLRIRASS